MDCNALIELGIPRKSTKVTFAADVWKSILEVTATESIVAEATRLPALTFVKLTGVIWTRAIPLASVSAEDCGSEATLAEVEKLTSLLAIAV